MQSYNGSMEGNQMVSALVFSFNVATMEGNQTVSTSCVFLSMYKQSIDWNNHVQKVFSSLDWKRAAGVF